MAGATGLEPATYGVTGRHSNQTELRPRNTDSYIRFVIPLQELFSAAVIFFQAGSPNL